MTSFHRDLRRMIASAALGSGVVLIAACGSSGSPASAPAPTKTVTATAPASTTPATPAPTPTPTQTGPLPCPTSALRSSVGSGNGAAGSTYYPLEFTNVSSTACTLFGYPGVSFVTGNGGGLIGRAASRNPAVSSQLVTIAAGDTAHATLQVVDAMNYPNADCHLVTAHVLKIYPPNQTAPIYLSFTAPTCSSRAKSVHILSVEAVQHGNGGG
jgi:Protein of unknown function (DUF4232)